MWLRKQFLRHMTLRHWLISSQRFKQMFYETPDDKSFIFFYNFEKPLPSDTMCFTRTAQSSRTNMDPKHKVSFLNLKTSSKQSDFSSSCFNKNRSLYRPGQTMKVPGIRGSQISRQPSHEGDKFVNPSAGRLYPPGNISCTHFC
jgi:hypothetical protein